MKYLIDLFLLWKCLPDVLRHFKLMAPATVPQNENGTPYVFGSASSDPEPTYVAVRPEKSEVYAKMVGAAYAIYNLLSGGR